MISVENSHGLFQCSLTVLDNVIRRDAGKTVSELAGYFQGRSEVNVSDITSVAELLIMIAEIDVFAFED